MIKAYVRPEDILIIAETWGNNIELNGKKTIQEARKGERGGGVVISLPSWWEILAQETLTGDGDDLAIRAKTDRDSTIWICAIYVKPGSERTFEKKIKKLTEWIHKIYMREKTPKILIAGDFNRNIADMLNGEEKTKRRVEFIRKYSMVIQDFGPITCYRSHDGSLIDFVVTSEGVRLENRRIDRTAATDHGVLTADLTMSTSRGRNCIVIPNKEFGEWIAKNAFKPGMNGTQGMLEYMKLLKEGLHNRSKVVRNKEDNRWRAEVRKIFTENDDMKEVWRDLSQRWNMQWKGFELARFSPDQKEAFKQLRLMTKYDIFDKRDGGVVNCIQTDEGKLITDPKVWQAHVIDRLNQVHDAPSERRLTEDRKWAGLISLGLQETLRLMESMSRGKAVTFDLAGDSMFKVCRIRGAPTQETVVRAEALRHIWNTDLINSRGFKYALEARLIPLNKKFPAIPKSNEIRPIVVSSQLIKFAEMRFEKKLKECVTYGICKAQTGFVPGMGTEVNLWRMLSRLKEKRTRKPLVLFIDFSNAYNTIFHDRLFRILRERKILEEEEIKYLEGLYSRTSIRLGQNKMRPKRGVMQGSPISPYLFDIYLDELLSKIGHDCRISLDDILAYADDVAIICDDIEEVKRVLKCIIKWSDNNGLALNKKKCGILQVVGPKQRVTMIQGEVEGIPICTSYKYLGLNIDNRMSAQHHINLTKSKINYLIYRLKWVPRNMASPKLRHNLWTVFIRPLLELGMMLRIVCNDSDNLALQRWIRGTFKRMMGLNQGVSNRICQRLMAVDLEEESKKRIERAEKRWRMRTQMREEEDEVRDRIDALSHKGNLKWVSEEMIMVANMMNHTICKRCEQNRISPKHITEAHGEICVEPDLESDLEQIMGIKTEKWRKLSGDERRIIEKVRELYKKIYDIFCKYSTNN